MEKTYKVTVKYKLFNEKQFDEFSDTYYIDTDYFYGNDDIIDYITDDALLVCGGGYNTKNIEKATVKINNKIVAKIDRTAPRYNESLFR